MPLQKVTVEVDCFGCFSWALHREPPALGDIIAAGDGANMRRLARMLRERNQAPPALIEALELAVKARDPNVITDTKYSQPLHEAVRSGISWVVHELLDARALPDTADEAGHTPLDVALQSQGGGEQLLTELQREQDRRTNVDFEELMSIIPRVHLFEKVQCCDYPRLAAAFTVHSCAPGDVVVKQGKPADAFYIVLRGAATVLIKQGSSDAPETVARLGMGDHFGADSSLLDESLHAATVVAAGPLKVKRLTREDFLRLNLHGQLSSRRRPAVRQADEHRKPTEQHLLVKTVDEVSLVRRAMRKNEHLAPLLKCLDYDSIHAIVAQAFKVTVNQGEVLVQQGDPRADLFYIVQIGMLLVIKDGKQVKELGPGKSFGGLSLFYRAPRAATVLAATPATLWAMPRQELRRVMQAPLQKKLESFARLLDRVELLKDVAAEVKASLADALVEMTFQESDYIVRQGEQADTFFILWEGTVAVEEDGSVVSFLFGDSDHVKASFFGEQALLEDQAQGASVRAVSKKVRVLALHRDLFLTVVNQRQAKVTDLQELCGALYRKENMDGLGVLGCGSFGVVSLVKCRVTGRSFALKTLSKGHIIKQGQEQRVMNEKNVMRMTRSPFLVRLFATFNCDAHLHFLLEPVMGGELFAIYQRRGFYGSERHARFYIACVLLALDHLHQRHVVYRDLKPENVLVDRKGYCKVADFGLAKFVIGHTYTTCGTPDYFAPEVISGSGHTTAVDWWTLGVMLYELMTGDTPFSGEESHETFANASCPG